VGEGEGIELIPQRQPPGDHRGIGRGTRLQALERRARGIVLAAEPRAHPHLADELDRGQEEIPPDLPF
jgi:hypothetical protein